MTIHEREMDGKSTITGACSQPVSFGKENDNQYTTQAKTISLPGKSCNLHISDSLMKDVSSVATVLSCFEALTEVKNLQGDYYLLTPGMSHVAGGITEVKGSSMGLAMLLAMLHHVSENDSVLFTGAIRAIGQRIRTLDDVYALPVGGIDCLKQKLQYNNDKQIVTCAESIPTTLTPEERKRVIVVKTVGECIPYVK